MEVDPGLAVRTGALRSGARGVEGVRTALEGIQVERVIEHLATALPGGMVEAQQAHAAAVWRLIVSDDIDDVDAISDDLHRAATAYEELERRLAAAVGRVLGFAW